MPQAKTKHTGKKEADSASHSLEFRSHTQVKSYDRPYVRNFRLKKKKQLLIIQRFRSILTVLNLRLDTLGIGPVSQ